MLASYYWGKSVRRLNTQGMLIGNCTVELGDHQIFAVTQYFPPLNIIIAEIEGKTTKMLYEEYGLEMED